MSTEFTETLTGPLEPRIFSEAEIRAAAMEAVRFKIEEARNRGAYNSFSVFTHGLVTPLVHDDKYSPQRMADCLKFEVPGWYYNVAHPRGSAEWRRGQIEYISFSNSWRKNTKVRRAILREMQEDRLLFFGRTMKVLDPSWTPDPNHRDIVL